MSMPAMTGLVRWRLSAASASRWPTSDGPWAASSDRDHGRGASVTFAALWDSLLPFGRNSQTGGYRRYSFTEADSACRDWFFTAAAQRLLRADCDRNGNLWAWWDPHGVAAPQAGAIVTGSHLDSVPDGGAFDGPLGVVSAFAAID